ncbi:MAG TPA: methyltransferase domain-containing protein [Burkholderiales bacterium]
MDATLSLLREEASRPFLRAGRAAWHYARGKFRWDPVYFALLHSGVLPDSGTLVDLGCGQGILLSLLSAAKEQYARGDWPADWPAPPARLAMHGYDLRRRSIRAGSVALDGVAALECRDIRGLALPPADAVVILDVLYHLRYADQERVLDAVAHALRPGGVLILRESNSRGGLAHRLQRGAEIIAQLWHGRLAPKLWYRDAAQWRTLLERRGMMVTTQPMNGDTPFANVLFLARRR